MELKMYNNEELAALRTRAREDFIRERTKEEQQFARWHASLLKTPRHLILDKLPFSIEDWTMQTLIPEYYVDVPNPEIVKQQRDEANSKIEVIAKIVYDLNVECIKVVEEFRQLKG